MSKKPYHLPGIYRGMRSSGLSLTTSIYEMLDNAIDHGKANNVDLQLSWFKTSDAKTKTRLEKVSIVDDGIGMNKEQLSNAFVLGYSSTVDDKNSIGRFGYGIKAGGLSQCRVIEIYSKSNNDKCYYVKFDYDEYIENKSILDEPSIVDVPEEYKNTLKNHGTAIIWSSLDIAEPLNKKQFEDLKFNIGRTFRKFIGSEIIGSDKNKKSIAIKNPNMRIITINNEKIKPHDPLFLTAIPEFETDLKASSIMHETSFDWPVHLVDQDSSDVSSDKIIIRMTILPKDWRHAVGSGGTDFARSRHINKNEGASILRNGREVYFGRSMFVKRRIEDDRWWGMEIEYPATLDHWFNIKNIKISLEPLKELSDELYRRVTPTVNRAREQIKSDRKRAIKGSKASKDPVNDGFKKAVGKNPRNNFTEEERKKHYDDLSKRFGVFENDVEKDKIKNYPILFINDPKGHQDGPFINIIPSLDQTELYYNTNHPFFHRLEEIIAEMDHIRKMNDEEFINSKNKIKKISNELRYCIDYLLGSFAGATNRLDPDVRQPIKQTVRMLIQDWSNIVSNVLDDADFKMRLND